MNQVLAFASETVVLLFEALADIKHLETLLFPVQLQRVVLCSLHHLDLHLHLLNLLPHLHLRLLFPQDLSLQRTNRSATFNILECLLVLHGL